MYKVINFDISGKCNAFCPWCYTGQRNLNSNNGGEFISPKTFGKAIKYLLDNGIMDKSTMVNMYNWGEPFLSPHLEDIINILNGYEIKYALSTNASKVVTFNEDKVLRNLASITFSMSGFSQESYNKIHGFNLEKIKDNIVSIINNFRNCGFEGQAKIAFHVYQFNLSEIEAAYKFAFLNNIPLYPSYAYLNGYSMLSNYLKSELSYEKMKKASQELMLYYINDKIKEKPEFYECPQFDMLTLDEKCNVLTCCGIGEESRDYAIGNLFELSLDQIRKKKLTREICKECDELGLNYIAHNPQQYIVSSDHYNTIRYVFRNIFNAAEGKNIGIYGTGTHTDKMLQVYYELFGPFKFNLIFFDSSPEKWGDSYCNSLIHNPQDMEKLNLNRVIISSYSFQEEIHQRIKKLIKSDLKIVKIYNQGDEILFK